MMTNSGEFLPRLNLGLTVTVNRVARGIVLCTVALWLLCTVLIGQSSQ